MYATGDTRLVYRRRTTINISMETFVATVMAGLIAVPSPISVSLTLGGAISLALAPVTFPALWHNSRGRRLLIVALALVPVGWLTAQASLLQDTGRTFGVRIFLYEAALPVGLSASVVGAYWCITKLGLQRFLLLAAIGLLATESLTYNPHNPWKYGLALPISVLAILLFARNRLILGLVIAPLLIAVTIAADYRSFTAILCIAWVLAIFARTRGTLPSGSKVASLAFVSVAAVVVVAQLIIQASTAGLLGEYLEKRTTDQLEVSNGNLILGGRAEWGGGIALLRENPFGIGIGVGPSSDDYWLVIRNMPYSSQGLQEISGVAKYFHQGQVELHSTFLTFWAVYGIAGVLFSILVLTYVGHATLVSLLTLGRPNLRAAVALLMLTAFWDILFSPTLVATLAISLAAAIYILGKPNIDQIRTKDYKHEISTSY